MFLGLVVIALLGLLIFRGYSPKKVELTSKDTVKEILHKQKQLTDSIKVLDKKLKTSSTIKTITVTKYITQKETIVEYKKQLEKGRIDTLTLIMYYDSTLATCDSLNKVNDTIISTYKSKTQVLDSINSSIAYQNYLAYKDISTLQKSLKQQKRKTTSKVIGSTIGSVALGFGLGFLTGFFK